MNCDRLLIFRSYSLWHHSVLPCYVISVAVSLLSRDGPVIKNWSAHIQQYFFKLPLDILRVYYSP